MSLFNTALEQAPSVVDLFNSDSNEGCECAGGTSQTPSNTSGQANSLRTPPSVPGSVLDDNKTDTTAKPDTDVNNRRLSDATGRAISLAGFSPRALTNMQTIVAEQSNIGRQDVTLPDGTVIRKAKDTQLSEGQRLQMVMTQLHGQCKNIHIRDSSSARALNTSILLEAILLGLAGLIDCLAGVLGLDFSTRPLLRSLNTPARRGDFNTIASVTGLIGSDEVNASHPDIANTILRNYERPRGRNRNQNGILGRELADGLSLINKNWRTRERNGNQVSDLRAYRGMSADAREVLSANPDTALDVQMAQGWDPTSMGELIGEYYPRASANSLTA